MSEIFQHFLQRSLEAHQRKHPDVQIDPTFFESIARCKFSTLSDEEIKLLQLDMPKIATTSTPGAADHSLEMVKKDPTPPKKALTAFNIYSREMMDVLRQENPRIGPVYLVMLVRQRWEAEVNKTKYETPATEDQERYEREMAAYTASVKSRRRKVKPKKDPNAPKRPRSAYIFFSQAEGKKVREANPGMSGAEATKIVAQRWGELEDKTEFEKMAVEDKARFHNETAAYSSSA